MLPTFELINGKDSISPMLVTIRDYGVWFEDTFDKYTAQQELYMKAKKSDGESVLEWHPGTNIGKWYDKHEVNSEGLKSWFIYQDSPMMERLVKLKLAEQKDAIPIAVNDALNRRMLRVYTVEQVELYIKNTIDRTFSITSHIATPKQIKVRDCDFDKLIMPKVDTQRKRLF